MELVIVFGLAYLAFSAFMIGFCMSPPTRKFFKKWTENRQRVEIVVYRASSTGSRADQLLSKNMRMISEADLTKEERAALQRAAKQQYLSHLKEVMEEQAPKKKEKP